MKKLATLLLSTMVLLSSNLFAQSGFYQGNGFSSSPSNGSYSSNAYSSSTPIYWLTNYSDAVAQSQSTSKPILILFTGTTWCPACIRLERTVLNHPEFAQAIGQRFIFLKAEFPQYSESIVAASPYKPLLDRYGVNTFPTMVVVNANGNMLFSLNYRDGGPQSYIQELLQKLGQR